MNITIIDQSFNGESIQTVNARDLHEFLEVGKDFSTWIKGRVEQYGFVDGRDYTTISSTPQNGGAGNRGVRIEYHISLDMAKELSMVERNDKGREARQYFIEMERRAKAGTMIDVRNPKQLANIAIQLIEVNREQAEQIESMKGDVEAHERLTKADGSVTITEAAKNLGMRPKDLFQWLSQNGWIYKRPGAANWLGYQPKCNSGLLEHKTNIVLRADGSEKITEQVRITAKGLSRLAKLIPGVVKEIAA